MIRALIYFQIESAIASAHSDSLQKQHQTAGEIYLQSQVTEHFITLFGPRFYHQIHFHRTESGFSSNSTFFPLKINQSDLGNLISCRAIFSSNQQDSAKFYRFPRSHTGPSLYIFLKESDLCINHLSLKF